MSELKRIKISTLKIFGDNARRLGKVDKELSTDEMIAIFESIDEKKILGEGQGVYSYGVANSNLALAYMNISTQATGKLQE